MYKIGEKIGEGRFVYVRVGYDTQNSKKVALKLVKKAGDSVAEKQIRNEFSILNKLNHSNIIRAKQLLEIEGKEGKSLVTVQDLCLQGDLLDVLISTGCFSEAYGREVFRQLAQAVAYIHEKKIAHRDLKPEQILFNAKYQVVLADFGLAKCFSDQTSDGFWSSLICGSPGYSPPEILSLNNSESLWNYIEVRDTRFLNGYDAAKADVFSLGVCLFCILAGWPPFRNAVPSDEQFRLIMKEDFVSFWRFCEKNGCSLSLPARDLLQQMLCADPMKRIRSSQILQHPWLNSAPPRSSGAQALYSTNSLFSFGSSVSTSSASYSQNRLSHAPPPVPPLVTREQYITELERRHHVLSGLKDRERAQQPQQQLQQEPQQTIELGVSSSSVLSSSFAIKNNSEIILNGNNNNYTSNNNNSSNNNHNDSSASSITISHSAASIVSSSASLTIATIPLTTTAAPSPSIIASSSSSISMTSTNPVSSEQAFSSPLASTYVTSILKSTSLSPSLALPDLLPSREEATPHTDSRIHTHTQNPIVTSPLVPPPSPLAASITPRSPPPSV
eukprot:TRINITY_DN2031_c0_g1_i1.p1 TRINITY_DN2031_c0_g1~~TRINITY_DN2031_c0_g1_i1.p1  ORF type:complete len:565 (+),score=114.01 TRINITY_DN2031_c0_g1_i1:23-1696(+)